MLYATLAAPAAVPDLAASARELIERTTTKAGLAPTCQDPAIVAAIARVLRGTEAVSV